MDEHLDPSLDDVLADMAAHLVDLEAAVTEYDEYKARRAVLETPAACELEMQFALDAKAHERRE